MKAAQRKLESHHRDMKKLAVQIWTRMDNPVFDSPELPEEGFPDEAIAIAKRGRRCTMETEAIGSNLTKRAIRDHERSALRHGNRD